MTALAAILFILAGAIFRRQLFLVLRWGLFALLALFALRFVSTLELPIMWWTGAAGGALAGFVVVGLLCFTVINNTLVERDRANDHAGIDKKHDARRL